uniref:Butyrophilin subfamily 1 member A1-like n=1 Tax=Electrophorus electricus TaxID=8005 RepID=A0A4W4E780_ELEEL
MLHKMFSVVVPQDPVTGLQGASVSLPCTLSNNTDAGSLEVRWYRPNMYNAPVLFYKNRQILESQADQKYQGRVSLLGIQAKGNVTLKLENLTLADRGDYICHVSSESWYEKNKVSLQIKVVGSTPVLSVAKAEDEKLNISCQSHGWFPEPSVIWTDKSGTDLKHLSKVKFTTGHALKSSSPCVYLSLASPHILGHQKQLVLRRSYGSAILLWVVGINACNECVVVICYKDAFLSGNLVSGWPGCQRGPGLLLHKTRIQSKRTIANTGYLDSEETPKFFRVGQQGKRVHCIQIEESDDNLNDRNFCLCKEQFSSGRKYWEVKVWSKPKEKLSWYVGVASDTAERKFNIPLIPKNGFWVLCYEKERKIYFKDHPVPLTDVIEIITTVGVFLDCDEHTLSFYDADSKSHIYTLSNVKAKALYPLISPGVRDKTPLHIVNKTD